MFDGINVYQPLPQFKYRIPFRMKFAEKRVLARILPEGKSGILPGTPLLTDQKEEGGEENSDDQNEDDVVQVIEAADEGDGRPDNPVMGELVHGQVEVEEKPGDAEENGGDPPHLRPHDECREDEAYTEYHLNDVEHV
jgi:hypothetical protein